MLISGVTVTTVRDGIDKVDVVARADRRPSAAISARLGDMVDLFAQRRAGAGLAGRARSYMSHEEPILWRRNRDIDHHGALRRQGRRPGRPTCPSASGRSSQTFASRLPAGYRMEIGGAIEESAKGNNSLVRGVPGDDPGDADDRHVPVAKFRPARPGDDERAARPHRRVTGAQLAGAPFGFVALLGLIALSGMDMRNSIILVDQVRQDLEQGANYREAIIERDSAARPAGRADRDGRDTRR